jgi:hypothetical protein
MRIHTWSRLWRQFQVDFEKRFASDYLIRTAVSCLIFIDRTKRRVHAKPATFAIGERVFTLDTFLEKVARPRTPTWWIAGLSQPQKAFRQRRST